MSLSALLNSAAFAPIANVGWIRVTGSDRVRWLNGMVTNSIQSLQPGEGCYNFFLNAQGRIQADCTAWMLADSILLQTAADRIPALMALLDHFIIMDDVELADISGSRHGLLIAGPRAEVALKSLNLWPSNTLGAPFIAPLSHAMSGSATEFVHPYSPVVPQFEIWADLEKLSDELFPDLLAQGVEHATPEDLELLRILSGTPLFGTDIRDKDLPQETNQTRALHFAKGCYLGQEIVERIRSRGAVHRTFSGFLLTGETPQPGAILSAEGKPLGELTSITSLSSKLIAQNSKLSETSLPPDPETTIALGYLRREALEKNVPLTYPGGNATPVSLPFQLA